MPAGSGVRAPAAAGRFYPADPDELCRLVDGLLDAVPVPAGEPVAAGYAVPHAGYQYSGPFAAYAYARLRAAVRTRAAEQGHSDGVRRVVLIGPAHYARLAGCAVPAARVWRGPLGDVPIDVGTAHRLVAAGLVSMADEPFAREHSLEVQLPFLQRCLAPVPVLPVVAGPATVDEVVAVLAATVEDGTLVLCSTDLSHYETDRVARQQDARTAKAVLDLTPDRIGVRDACGVFALRGLLGWARRAGLRARLLRLGTSADTSGDPQRVVGYGAFAFDRVLAAQ